jgi:hypothetical protein
MPTQQEVLRPNDDEGKQSRPQHYHQCGRKQTSRPPYHRLTRVHKTHRSKERSRIKPLARDRSANNKPLARGDKGARPARARIAPETKPRRLPYHRRGRNQAVRAAAVSSTRAQRTPRSKDRSGETKPSADAGTPNPLAQATRANEVVQGGRIKAVRPDEADAQQRTTHRSKDISGIKPATDCHKPKTTSSPSAEE